MKKKEIAIKKGSKVIINVSCGCCRDRPMFTSRQITEQAAFRPRSAFGMQVFKNKLWVMGGVEISAVDDHFNDVWSSTNGTNWNEIVQNAPFDGRAFLGSAVFDDKLWVIGGSLDPNIPTNDAWHSTDGVNWVKASDLPMSDPNNDFPFYYFVFSFKNKLWIRGAEGMYNSDDGITWNPVPEVGMPEVKDWQVVVFDDKVWGFVYDLDSKENLIYTSNDGINWKELVSAAGLTLGKRYAPVVHEGKLFALSADGYIRYSEDGILWKGGNDAPYYSARACCFRVASFKDKIWVIGGQGKHSDQVDVHSLNDIWAIDTDD